MAGGGALWAAMAPSAYGGQILFTIRSDAGDKRRVSPSSRGFALFLLGFDDFFSSIFSLFH